MAKNSSYGSAAEEVDMAEADMVEPGMEALRAAALLGHWTMMVQIPMTIENFYGYGSFY